MKFDVFISHASEDKADIVVPLSSLLREHGLNVWLDRSELHVGDSLRRKIDEGLRSSRYGVVILSPSFFSKEWPKKELDALLSREDGRDKVILPVLHNISHKEIEDISPLLADKLAVSTQCGIDLVAREIIVAIKGEGDFYSNRASKRTVIGLSGASCSGKSWLAEKFVQLRPDSVTLFDLDSYYKNYDYILQLENKHDNPDAIKFEDALIDLALLKSGSEINIPCYSYETHSVAGSRLCCPKSLIVVEGIFVFANERLRRELDVKIWIDAGEDMRYERRMRRDTLERGRDINEVLERYANDVRPGYKKYIRPLREYADFIYENNGRNLDQQPKFIEMLLAYVDQLERKRND